MSKREPAYITEREIFPTRLRELMYERGLNLSDLAKKTGLQRQTISLYATGQRNPDTERLTSICHALNCSSDYLLGLSNEKTSSTVFPK